MNLPSMMPLPKNERLPITYPFATPPGIGDGSVVEIAPGHFWARIPMPLPPGFTNVVLIREETGWTVVDTGMRSVEAERGWHLLQEGALARRPITRVIGTHMHGDHVGLAGWIMERHPAVLWMTGLEYMTERALAAARHGAAPAAGTSYYHRAGWDEQVVKSYQDRYRTYAAYLYPLPDHFRRIVDGERLTIAGNEWEVIVGAGHSPEHASLLCRALGLYLAADQLLPRISPNISVPIAEPWADPLSAWLVSLEQVKRRVPDDMLVIPGHNLAFHGVHQRADALIAEHEAGLDRLATELRGGPRRCIDLFAVLFPRPVVETTRFLATGECLAHLHCLQVRGLATSEVDGNGVVWWSA